MYVALFWALVLLLIPGSKNRAKHFLGFFMIGATLVYFSHAVFFSKQTGLYVYFDSIYVLATLSVYPLYYWYIRLLTVESSCRVTMIWHFVPPFLIASTIAIVYILMEFPLDYIQHCLYKKADYAKLDDSLWKLNYTLTFFSRIYLFIQVVWLLPKGLKLIHDYESRLKAFYSNLEGRSVNWAKWLIVIFTITAVMSTVANIIGRSYFVTNNFLLAVPAIVFTVLIFIIGYLGHVQQYSVFELQFEEAKNDAEMYRAPENVSILSNQILTSSLKLQLIDLFENKVMYCQSDLKISTICEALNTNRTYVSKLINDEFLCSFSDFVNKYRVDAAKKLILDDTENNYTLEQIAEKVGYSSAGTMIRNFKSHYNMTPGMLRQKKRVVSKS